MVNPIINKMVMAIVLLLGSYHCAMAEGTKYEIDYLLMDSNMGGAGFEPNALQYKHLIPYNDFIELEGIIALGITEEKVTRKTGIAGIYTQKFGLSNMLGAMVKIFGAIEPKVHAYAHIGLVRIEYDITSPAGVGQPDGAHDDTGFAYGIGLSFSILKKGAFVLEFNQRPDVDAGSETIDTSLLSLGYQMPF